MNKRKLIFALAALLAIGCGTTLGQAPMVSIPIVDPDFESQSVPTGPPITDPAGCATSEAGQVAGWLGSGASFGVAHWTCDDGMPPSNVAYLGYGSQGSKITQLLTEEARPGVYVLQFDVANWFYSYPGDWNALLYQGNLDAGGNLILSPAPFCNFSGWSEGDFKRITMTCPLDGYLINNGNDSLSVGGQVKGHIVIVLQNHNYNPALGGHAGWPILIDNVTLSFTPQS